MEYIITIYGVAGSSRFTRVLDVKPFPIPDGCLILDDGRPDGDYIIEDIGNGKGRWVEGISQDDGTDDVT